MRPLIAADTPVAILEAVEAFSLGMCEPEAPKLFLSQHAEPPPRASGQARGWSSAQFRASAVAAGSSAG